MRFLSSLFLGFVAAVLTLALAVFALQNIGAVPVQFLGYSATGNLWWVALAAAALGFVVAMLLMAPGRVAASWRIQGLSRQMQRQDEELATIHQQQTDGDAERDQFQQQYQQLQAQRDLLANERQSLVAERDRLAAERDDLLGERYQPSQPVQQPVEQPVIAQPQPAVAIVPGMAAAPFVDMPTSVAPAQSDMPREDVVVAPRAYAAPSDATTDGEQPSLANRVLSFFRSPLEDDTPAASSDDDDTTLPDAVPPREDRPVSPMA